MEVGKFIHKQNKQKPEKTNLQMFNSFSKLNIYMCKNKIHSHQTYT